MLFLILTTISSATSLIIEEIPPTGTPPPPYLYSSLAYLNSKIYSFGGMTKNYNNELWEFDGMTFKWRKVAYGSEVLPKPRKSAIFIGAFGKLYLYGGETESGVSADLWSFDVETTMWTQVTMTGDLPLPRSQLGFAYDLEEFLYIFGGVTYKGPDNMLYRLSLSTLKWTFLNTTNPPSPRCNCGLVYYLSYLFIWGGNLEDTSLYYLDLSTGNWAIAETIGTPPSPRQSFPIFAFQDFIYIFIGFLYDFTSKSDGCFRISLTAYAWEEIDCPCQRIVWAYTEYEGYLALFGGANHVETSNELIFGDFTSSIRYFIASENWVYPPARMKHSLLKTRSFLWLFGGVNNDEYFNDVWKYDLINNYWSQIDPPNFVPSARSHHGSSIVLGDTIVIFGGKNADGFLNDMYLYNMYTNRWVAVDMPNMPSARASPCVAYYYPNLYIYGGENENGELDDFWNYSFNDQTLVQIDTGGFQPPPLTNSQCIVGDDKLFYIFSGETNPYVTVGRIFYYIPEQFRWSYLSVSDERITQYGNSFTAFMSSNLVLFGGRRTTVAFSNIITMNYLSLAFEELGQLLTPMAAHAGAHAGKSVYLHGGFEIFSNSLILKHASAKFYKITSDTFDCSDGYFGADCQMCLPGYYNSDANSLSCAPCKPGTFNPYLGGSVESQCIPCSNGYFADKEASLYCKQCDFSMACLPGTSIPTSDKTVYDYSMQPKPYDDNKTRAQAINSIISFCFLGSIVPAFVFIFLLRRRNSLLKLDLYKALHPRKYYEEPYATSLGAMFSLIFILIALLFIITPVVLYITSNITEFKTLVPDITLETLTFRADMTMTIIMYNYNGDCQTVDGFCNINLYTSMMGTLQGRTIFPTCYKVKNDCFFTFKCEECRIDKYTQMNVTIVDTHAYTGKISVTTSALSSIPGEISSITLTVEADKNKVFNGFYPSKFYYFIIPSVFYTDSSNWKDEQVGYHVTYRSLPDAGSSFTPSEISFYNALTFSIEWSVSPNILVTKRTHNIYLITMLSAILGSVAGLFGAFGSFMGIFEKSLNKVKAKIDSEKHLQDLKNQRKHLSYLKDKENDSYSEDREKGPTSVSFDIPDVFVSMNS